MVPSMVLSNLKKEKAGGFVAIDPFTHFYLTQNQYLWEIQMYGGRMENMLNFAQRKRQNASITKISGWGSR